MGPSPRSHSWPRLRGSLQGRPQHEERGRAFFKCQQAVPAVLHALRQGREGDRPVCRWHPAAQGGTCGSESGPPTRPAKSNQHSQTPSPPTHPTNQAHIMPVQTRQRRRWRQLYSRASSASQLRTHMRQRARHSAHWALPAPPCAHCGAAPPPVASALQKAGSTAPRKSRPRLMQAQASLQQAVHSAAWHSTAQQRNLHLSLALTCVSVPELQLLYAGEPPEVHRATGT